MVALAEECRPMGVLAAVSRCPAVLAAAREAVGHPMAAVRAEEAINAA